MNNILTYSKFLNESVDKALAVFMDLDHTIIKPKSGKTFPINIDDWYFIPGVLNVMKKFQEDGHMIIVVSNQGGIDFGYQTEEEIKTKFRNIKNEAKNQGVNIEKFYFCPSNDKENINRKPNPGMVRKASEDFGIDVENSIMVGDLDSDRQLAVNAGIKTYYDIKEFLEL
jgi:D-glycero-D-manno-heptose 1,7-bisphosphate phosphatase